MSTFASARVLSFGTPAAGLALPGRDAVTDTLACLLAAWIGFKIFQFHVKYLFFDLDQVDHLCQHAAQGRCVLMYHGLV